MSGNPFRRQVKPAEQTTTSPDKADDSLRVPPVSTLADDGTGLDIATRGQILGSADATEKHTGPPRSSDATFGFAPPSLTNSEDGYSTASTTIDSDLEPAIATTRRKPGIVSPPATSFVQHAAVRAPFNPFTRTLATPEVDFRSRHARDGTAEVDFAGERNQAQPNGSRPVVDVDQFNLSMTGSVAPSARATQHPQQRPQDSSSSTDTSSISRQSIFDNMLETHPESPRTSADFDHPPYGNGTTDDEDDDEQSSLMGPMETRPVAEGPPPPPKYKSGRGFPQTVSFADFDESIPSGFSPRPRQPPLSTHLLTGILRPSTPRSPSDINKPLPPPPAELSRGDAAPVVPTKDAWPHQLAQAYLLADADAAQARKPPPPPPASRRAGKAQGRPRSTSNLTLESTADEEANDVTLTLSSPPSAHRTQPPPRFPSPAVETPFQVPPPTQAQTEMRAMPPPPPRRSTVVLGSSVERTPSNASRSSLPRTDSGQASITSSSAPPVPPPRRAGGSKRSSMDESHHSLSARNPDYRRSSGQSFGSDRSTSLSGLHQVHEPGEMSAAAGASTSNGEPESNILADLTAFHAEIEALRAQAAMGG